MSNWKEILRHTQSIWFQAGGTVSNSTARQLRAHRQRMFFIFILLFLVIVSATAFGAYGLAIGIHDPGQLKAFSAAMGISLGGLIEVLRRISKEWSQTDLLLVLIEDAEEAQVRALIDKLIGQL